MKKLLILGAKGMLGQELVKAFSENDAYHITAWDKGDFDFTQGNLLKTKLAELGPDIVLNAAAYNAVDLIEESEEERGKAVLINAKFPESLAKLSEELHFTLVHYSTDYVFDGTLEPPVEKKCQGACCGGNCHGTKEGYDEGSLPNPVSKYGETKLAGEQAVASNTKRYYLIRLSKLFGKPALSSEGKKSFFDTMLELGRKNSSSGGEISVVDGERSCFTYAPDLARATKEILEDQVPFGIYHLVNEGAVTWYEGVLELYRQAGITVAVKPVSSDSFPRPAKRPAVSVLLNTKRPKLRHYSEALGDFLRNNTSV